MYFTNGTEPKWLLCLLYTWATIDSPKHLCFSQSLSLDPYLEPSLLISLWDPILCKRLHVLCKEIQGIKLIVTRKPILQNSTVLKYISKRQKKLSDIRLEVLTLTATDSYWIRFLPCVALAIPLLTLVFAKTTPQRIKWDDLCLKT